MALVKYYVLFSGFQQSYIYYNTTKSTWIIQSLRRKNINKGQRGIEDLPLGRLNWRLEHLGGEVDSGNENSDIGVPLAFSSCTDGQFTCDSGDCVDELRYLFALAALRFLLKCQYKRQ